MDNNLDTESDAILITGPTASGKSALAVELARRHGGVVINADSMQVYDTLRLLTARPDEADMGGIEHCLYGHVPAASAYSTGAWAREAQALVARLRGEGRLPVFVGGTGLYFKALTGGLSDMPEIPAAIRERLRERLKAEGPEILHRELAAKDPETAATLKAGDGQRIVRALEVVEATDKPIRFFQQQSGPVIVDPDRAQKFVVQPERKVLHERINRRFEAMLSGGAIDEVRALLALDLPPEMPVMKAIGVSQIAALLKGEIDEADVIETSSAATRQYAKRQMTWFRNQLDDSWLRIESAAAVL
ncbi:MULTISPECIES: tRNA (adenosine(37)-N6)-dimethylallyltransferase MiaA [unclassified Ensifer]|uniref:tRNA (adenosine(37)-N6)-dimethylallyltransferase MiaA n=1 Tax=unclassified Ensifer TaxID=2633371 RepID=UPI000813936F|nr:MULTISPECIES: tRNA (adenosine(37)-N6)-dimethylallyltransferase MiaA [unclassified Ensifer]OCP01690.1 tRNA (adenosine(37)-N6)-dimethylallyltransferase MiaA [Ensifer sp. LC14]OCP09478.1 tRNA (adenosine(37)-N6)-dimethylallyltransferase MiaA [Ensifer sp. LC13]OCP10652.1 tRNA (adenosine(37)-N6)-dimethylallyltransferase MiaA [Ensifer sp. LC11]OCP32726.1 tRNA (adenosine(37)-N6)-dimethylallyltransferase MiaA [Ensifer sp. LC499]